MASFRPHRIVLGRPFLFASIVIGALAWLLMPWRISATQRGILAWDMGGLCLLLLYAGMFSLRHSRHMEQDAERQQAGEWSIFWITIAGATASFAAIVHEFSGLKDLGAREQHLRVGLVGATLLISWLITHTLFAVRYAHEYYERTHDAAEVDRGLDFPGDKEPDYWDFLYFSIVLGMTFQVSDVQITSRKLRRLAIVHGLLSFLFNTVILALTINLAAGLL